MVHDDGVVQIHLEHRLVRRLLARFLSQGFPPAELAGFTVAATDSVHPLVVLIGRISLFGSDAARLHDQLVLVAARLDADVITVVPAADDERLWDLIGRALHRDSAPVATHAAHALIRRAPGDLEALRTELDRRIALAADRAKELLDARGTKEAEDLRRIISEQIQHCANRLNEIGCVPHAGDSFKLPYEYGGTSFCNIVGVDRKQTRGKGPGAEATPLGERVLIGDGFGG